MTVAAIARAAMQLSDVERELLEQCADARRGSWKQIPREADRRCCDQLALRGLLIPWGAVRHSQAFSISRYGQAALGEAVQVARNWRKP